LRTIQEKELRDKSSKILIIYAAITFTFIIFLSVMLSTALKNRKLPHIHTLYSSKAQRGSIISADGYKLAITKKLYKAIVDTRYIDPNKEELFVSLFSIYSKIPKDKILNKLHSKRGNVVLSYSIAQKEAQYLKKLAYELRRLKVFIERKDKNGILRIHGLNIIESGESRIYPYGNLLTPIIGYPHKVEINNYTTVAGVQGIERKFNDELSAKQDSKKYGTRDVNGYIILNKKSYMKEKIDGLDIKLTIPVSLQIKVESMLDRMKEQIDAKEIMVAVMDIKTSNILALASSNRFLPKHIKKSDYPYLRSGMVSYSFEPGSVIKTVTFSLLLDKGLINPYDLVNAHNGRFRIGRKVITDEHRFDWISAENIIVHSSNIGIAQLAQKLSGFEFYQGLLDFGFSKKSTPDLIFEKVGSIPNQTRLNNEIYKATCSYGYGLRVNLMQLIRAYSVFNNGGYMLTPRIVDYFIDEHNKKEKIAPFEPIQVIKPSTAQRVKKVLIKTVLKGTGKKAIIKGLEIGGKTGTAHKVEKGEYIAKYNTSFIGFANDKKHKYTIGVVVIEPKSSQFASKTAVPVFKEVVNIMVEDKYLTPYK
jgi:cell division protein FtsI (penicillin-binding protein 3)